MRFKLFVPLLPVGVGHACLQVLFIVSQGVKAHFENEAVRVAGKVRQGAPADTFGQESFCGDVVQQGFGFLKMPEFEMKDVACDIHSIKV